MKCIVGLGNPGKEYENTRHNIGFMVLDAYAKEATWQKKFDGFVQIITVNGEKVLLIKPLTFMNLSGDCVRKAVDFYHISVEEILVVQDDLDLPFGKVRIKKNSSAGGHNGIKSIIRSLQSDAFCRLKIGIGFSERIDTVDYVLSKFSKKEMAFLEDNLDYYCDIINTFLMSGVSSAMSKYN